MNYNLDLNDRPFNAIKAGTKKVEGRTPTNSEENINVRKMLEKEGTKNVLSSGLDIEGGIESYNSLDGYKESIKKYGIYAIGIKVK